MTRAANYPELPIKVNFQDAAGTTPAGWTKDYGQNYSNTKGFGWIVPGSQVPLSLLLNGRTRPAESGVDPTLTSTMHMQGNTILNFSEQRPAGCLAAGGARTGATT